MNAPINTDDNRPQLITSGQLSKDFDYLEINVEAALDVASKLPPAFEDEEDISAAREAVRGLLNEIKRAETKREDTKAPYLDAGRVVDSWFKSLIKRCTDAQAPIEARAKRWLDKKAAEERAGGERDECLSCRALRNVPASMASPTAITP